MNEFINEIVIKLLEDNHIARGHGTWPKYDYCKKLLEKLELDSTEWHDACVVIADYLGV